MNLAAIDLRLLRSFLSVARTGSLTRAAQAVHVTQPALSQQMRELAGLMGVQLLDRVGRGVELTPAGHELFLSLEPLLGDLELALSAVSERSLEIRGTLRIGAIGTYARALVVPSVSRLLASHSQLRVQVEELTAAQIDSALQDNQIDVGLSFSDLSRGDISQCQLFEETLALISRWNHSTTSESVGLEEVASQPLALLNRTFTMRRQIDSAFRAERLILDVRLELANIDSLLSVAQCSDLAVITSSLGIRDPASFLIRPILHDAFKRTAALRWRRGRSPNAAVSVWRNLLAEQIRQTRGIRLAAAP
jgi:LysR family cyn operon transcriptional activator